jgi:8-oxo-dGTP pyrophosphatase MutT (NUDIX family)
MEKIIEIESLFKGRKFEVQRRTVEDDQGRLSKWEVVHKGGDSVAMVAVDSHNKVYLVEEYFAAINARTLCLPKGMIEPGEAPEAAAIRELQEEVGYAGRARKLATVSVSPGYLTQMTTLFLVTNLVPSKLIADETHFLAVRVFDLDEAISMIRSGEISEARTVAGLILARNELASAPH